MLPEYARLCEGEGGMHDTAMLLGLLGWDEYDKPVEIVTEYFPELRDRADQRDFSGALERRRGTTGSSFEKLRMRSSLRL